MLQTRSALIGQAPSSWGALTALSTLWPNGHNPFKFCGRDWSQK